MKVAIIEDEPLTAEDLANILVSLPDTITVVQLLSSVRESVDYLKQQPDIDLLFCDVQLGDGFSFDIFKLVRLNIPVIFCTAYDHYAIEAFKNNGVGYVLKPFTTKSVKEAVERFMAMREKFSSQLDEVALLLQQLKQKAVSASPSSLLVNWKDRIVPVRYADIALFGIDHKSTRLVTRYNEDYPVSYNLDELEKICGASFYRANRQYLINRDAVKEVLQYNARKLFVKLSVPGNYDITIAKAKVPEFLGWLRN